MANQNTALQTQPQSVGIMAMDVKEVQVQINAIQNLMRSLMKQGVHYDTVPGCGNKKMLLKPGAELIGFTFRIRPEYKLEIQDLGDGQKNFEVICNLYHIPTGNIVGSGVGSCSTMETKYRYRNDILGDVPKEWWQTKDSAILGGPDCEAKKVKGNWKIVRRAPVKDIADVWNTCLKMAKKRAHGDAIQSSTAASDMFDQFAVDPDDIDHGEDQSQSPPKQNGNGQQRQQQQPPKQTQQKQPQTQEQPQEDDDGPRCPECGSDMTDLRNGQRHATKGPDFRCTDKNCKDSKGYTTCIWRIEYPDEQQDDGPGY